MLHEIRVYHCTPGCVPKVLDRFENIVFDFWEKYGIKSVGFWTTYIGESNMDIKYLLEWESRAEREEKWNAFQADPEWIKKRAATEPNGPIVASYSNQILQPTKFSNLK